VRFSILSLVSQAVRGQTGWPPQWRDAPLQPAYDVLIVGGGGHGLATAYYLAKEHGIANVAVLEKGWLGGGNVGRNTTIVRSNYLLPGNIPFYEWSMKLWEGLERDLNYNAMALACWAEARGAQFVAAGEWLRAQGYPEPGETDWLQSVSRDVSAVRNRVGVCDVSTLGKIDVQGTDAVALLDRLYINGVSSLDVGRARYGVMLREDDFVLDDGTFARLGPDRFIVTTTTANAAKVLQHMELAHQWLWPELDVQLCSSTEQWAQFSVAGPHTRSTLGAVIDPEHDISNAAFPYMATADLTALGGVPARLFRLSFSGELAYEIAVPAGYGDTLMRRVMEAGQFYGVAAYGTEALGVMRVEKGHVGGGELNGQTTARDLGLGRMMSARKDYIGRILAQRPGLTDPDRPTLVGLKPVDRAARLRPGAHLIPRGAEPVARNDQGYVTSAAFSPTLGHWICLGLLARGPQRHGERIRACDPVRGGDTLVEVCAPVFLDPQGERLRG
jgi:sarcosine oxidase subunit alpha